LNPEVLHRRYVQSESIFNLLNEDTFCQVIFGAILCVLCADDVLMVNRAILVPEGDVCAEFNMHKVNHQGQIEPDAAGGRRYDDGWPG
jgi:hypothetical protein